MRVRTFVTVIAGLFLFHALAGSFTSSSDADFNKPREIRNFPSDHTLRAICVVTWNVDYGAAFQLIGSELAKNPADLCLLQEVDWNTSRTGQADVAGQLAKRLKLNLSYGLEFEELSQESTVSELDRRAHRANTRE